MNRFPFFGLILITVAGCSSATTSQQTPPGPTGTASTQQSASSIPNPVPMKPTVIDTDVRGVVQLNGRPLSGAVVVFHSAEGQSAIAFADNDGKYELPAMNPGVHKVTVETKLDPSQKGNFVPIPKRYAKPETSGIQVDVKPGANMFDIQLSSN